jgi:alkylation response protein AidB-like acyl-CoA dehydrogenase
MQFTFNEDQQLFQTTVRDFLAKECTPEQVRAAWADDDARVPELWVRLSELGLPGLLVPEAHQGMGMDEVDFVLLQEEAGRAAVFVPLVATAAVAVPLLVELGDADLAARWLPPIAAGQALVAVGHGASPYVTDADRADLLLLPHGEEVHALDPSEVRVTRQPGNDPSRRLFRVDWTPGPKTRVASAEPGRELWAAALDRGALACAAQQLGVTDRLVTLAVEYAEQRHQFGKPIGSFQAVKHMLANVKVMLEYARPAVHRAAWSVARAVPERGLHASMAKVLASDAALHAARVALQVHGAIGYTWEQDLHIWMRRAWSLEQAWGRSDFHRARVEQAILADGARLGPGETFRGDE